MPWVSPHAQPFQGRNLVPMSTTDSQGSSEAQPLAGIPAPFAIVGIGASAGGLEAFTALLALLPPDTGMAFVLIQHLDPTHTSFLSEALGKATAMPVSQAEDGTLLQPNHVYVIPPNAELGIEKGQLTLTPRPSDGRTPHHPVDAFFRALAAERGPRAIGVVLSGTASDGTEGLRAVKAADGITFAQDPKSAKFSGMPASAIDAGVVDYSLPIGEIASELVRLSHHPYVEDRHATPQREGDAFREIFALVRNTVGIDFSEYKLPTIERRLARRLAVHRVKDAHEYLAILQADPAEVRALAEDVLIHVTSFFRDPEVFELLKARVFPEIIKRKADGAAIRIWVPGCSTGEEVYSLGITLFEVLGHSSRPIQIFGTDVSESAIEKARAGLYSDSVIRNVSDEQRRRYFSKTERGHRVTKALRDVCVFVRHDLARDPPFSKLDLVSCRNLLIYFGEALQKRIIPTLHYSLNESGFLVIGRNENVSAFTQLFSPLEKSAKVFTRTRVRTTLRFPPRDEAPPADRTAAGRGPASDRRVNVDLSRQLDHFLLARYASPGVLINDQMDILHFRGETDPYLRVSPGAAQNNVVRMARPGLISALLSTIARAKQKGALTRKKGVEVEQDGLSRTCDLVVVPFLSVPEAQGRLYLVLFEDVAPPTATAAKAVRGKQRAAKSPKARQPRPGVEQELAATKHYLQSLIDDHGRTNDDLGSANEELVSGNEELQSMNEELETAKEELQSINEELNTVNEEMRGRNQEVTQVNSDLVNVLGAVDIPILILDIERRIRRFTPKARTILNVLPSDTGRPLDDIKPNLDVLDLDGQVAEVIETVIMKESEVRDRDGHWYRMQIRPYKTTDNRIDGAILSLVDIDALKQHVNASDEAQALAERANHAKDQFLATLSHELRTPLASIFLRAQQLQRVPMDDTRMKHVGEVIERSAKLQMQLINDLLDVSRIVTGKLHLDLKPVNLGTAARAALEGVTPLAERRSIAIEFELDESNGVVVAGDMLRLQQIISNLLTNAIKFTPERGQVAITVDSADGQARLKVTDSGMGIDARFLPHVFDRFSQEDTSNARGHAGLGLGLAIVRHLVELHGGIVQAASPGTGKGATFSVSLPLKRRSADQMSADNPSPPAEPHESRGAGDHGRLNDLRLLVVDDDSGTREAVAEMLAQLGAKVALAASAAEAMTALGEFRPEVLLCDIAMPGEDGYTLLRKIRAVGPAGGGDIPALALTALAGDDDRQQALSSGFQMHMIKPFDIGQLTEAVVELSKLVVPSAARSFS